MLGLLLSDELEGKWEEVVVVYFIVLYQHLPGELGRSRKFTQKCSMSHLKMLGARRMQWSEDPNIAHLR